MACCTKDDISLAADGGLPGILGPDLWLLLATSRMPSVTCKMQDARTNDIQEGRYSRDIHRKPVTHSLFNPFVSKSCPRPTSLVISAAVQDLGSITMKLTTILSCMLHASTAVLAAPATIERRISYNGGTTAWSVVNKCSRDGGVSCVRILLALIATRSTLYTSYIHLRPMIQ
jgi:hypothetical protein